MIDQQEQHKMHFTGSFNFQPIIGVEWSILANKSRFRYQCDFNARVKARKLLAGELLFPSDSESQASSWRYTSAAHRARETGA